MKKTKAVNRTTVALKPETIKKANQLMGVYKADLNMATLHRTTLVELLINEAHTNLLAGK